MLTLVPNLIGSILRIPYTFAVPTLRRPGVDHDQRLAAVHPRPAAGGRRAERLAGPPEPQRQFWVLFLCAATAGLGGGNFSSSMANISFFYPERKKGFALGLNAAGGNLGVAVAQLFVPLVIIIGVASSRRQAAQAPGAHGLRRADVASAHRHRGGRRVAVHGQPHQAKADTRAPTSWPCATARRGSCRCCTSARSARSSASRSPCPLVIKNTFPEFLAGHPFIATYLAGLGFVGALIGSLSRPVGGWLSDKVGGAKVTLVGLRRHGGVHRSRDRRGRSSAASPCSSAPTW